MINVNITYSLTEDAMRYFGIYFPEYFVETSLKNLSKPRVHGHPMAALERRLLETDVFRFVQLNGKTALDVGGTPARHAAAGRLVHSCNPICEPADLFRERARERAATKLGFLAYCDHKVQECDCLAPVRVGLVTFIHSIYYFTPDEVADVIRRYDGARVLAVYHPFNDVHGALFGGEAKYEVAAGMVSCVFDTGTTYKHSDCAWLSSPSKSTPVVGGSLAWDVVRRTPNSVVVEIVFTKMQAIHVDPIVETTKATLDVRPKGVVYKETPYNANWSEFTASDVHHVPFTNLPFTTQRQVSLPTEIVHKMIGQVSGFNRMAGPEAREKMRANLVSVFKNQCHIYNLSSTEATRIMNDCISVAWSFNEAEDMAVVRKLNDVRKTQVGWRAKLGYFALQAAATAAQLSLQTAGWAIGQAASAMKSAGANKVVIINDMVRVAQDVGVMLVVKTKQIKGVSYDSLSLSQGSQPLTPGNVALEPSAPDISESVDHAETKDDIVTTPDLCVGSSVPAETRGVVVLPAAAVCVPKPTSTCVGLRVEYQQQVIEPRVHRSLYTTRTMG